MWTPPKFTAVWPETAFEGAGWRLRQGSSDSAEESSNKKSGAVLRPSKARHPLDAARIGNAVVDSYLSADTYSDYRGAIYVVRTAAHRLACSVC